MFGQVLRCAVCNQYKPDRCICPRDAPSTPQRTVGSGNTRPALAKFATYEDYRAALTAWESAQMPPNTSSDTVA
jgi:hypothetical protein